MLSATLVMVAVLISMSAMLILFYVKPTWGLAMLIASLPFERIGSFALNPIAGYPIIQPSQLVGAALIAAVGLRLVTRRDRLNLPRASWWLIGLAGIAGASATFIGYRQTLVDYLSGLLVILLSLTVTQIILSATAGLAGRKQVLSLLRLSVLIATVAVCLFGLYQFFGDLLGLSITQTGLRPQYTKAVFGFPRIQATALEPLYFANYLLMPLLVSAALFITTKKKLFLGILGLISVVFALTVSRGAMIGAVIGFIVLILCLYKSFDRRVLRNVGLAIAGIILLVVGGLTLAGISNPTQGKSAIGTFAGLFGANFNQTATLTQRLDAQKQAWNIFLEKPLIGHGIGGYTWRVLNYPAVRTGGERIIVNNEPLELLAEVGILGTLAYLGFLVTLLWGGLRAGLRETNPERRAWLFGLTAAIIAIWVQYLSFSGFYIIHIWVAYGLLLGFIGMKPAETTK